MALQAYLDSIDDLPSDVKEHYKSSEAEGGGYVLDTKGVEDVSGLKSALEKERKSNREAKDFHSKNKDYDFEQVKTLEADFQKKLEEAAGNGKQIDELKTTYANEKSQLIELHNAEKEKLVGLSSEKDGTINDLMITQALRKEISQVAIDADATDLIMNAVENEFEVVVDDDNKRAVRVKDGKGGHKIKSGGSYQDIASRVAEMAGEKRFARLISGSGNSGGGTFTPKAGGPGKQTYTSNSQQIAAGLKNRKT
jgi:hypothetical protein